VSSGPADGYSWADALPDGCPPADARPPRNESFYRLVASIPPSDEDFWSFRKRNPQKEAQVGECIARACSLWETREACMQAGKLPSQRNKHVAILILPPESGLVKRTGHNAGHVSWWRAQVFDPVSCCQ
jgi:hypothetical protein